MKVLMVEQVGNACGPYTYILCKHLKNLGVDITMATSDSYTYLDEGDFPIIKYFCGISGDRNIVNKGINYLKGLKGIIDFCKEKKPEIVHLQWFLLSPIDYWFVSWLKNNGIKVFITAHDILPFNEKFYDKKYLSQIYKLANGIFVHAAANKEELCKFVPQVKNNIEIIPHGSYEIDKSTISVTKEQARKKLGISDEDKVILFFGQIKKVKGLQYLIKAFCKLYEKRKDIKLVIAGKVWKDEFDYYDGLITDKAREAVIKHIRFISDSEVQDFFICSDMVVLPYIKVYQSGVAHLAFAYKRPLIATGVGGLTDLIQHEKTGLLIPAESEVELENAIEKLLDNEVLRKTLAENAFDYMNSELSIGSKAKKVKGIYTGGIEDAGSFMEQTAG